MSVYEIPLTPKAQTFGISLGGRPFRLTLQWNAVSSCWVIDIADDNNVMILSGIPLVTGADLLAQYAHLNFGGVLVCQTDGDIQAVPTYANIGTGSHLYFVSS